MCHRFHTCINVMFVLLQLTQQRDQLAAMLRQARETTTDSKEGARRALADLVYHECGRLDVWTKIRSSKRSLQLRAAAETSSARLSA